MGSKPLALAAKTRSKINILADTETADAKHAPRITAILKCKSKTSASKKPTGDRFVGVANVDSPPE